MMNVTCIRLLFIPSHVLEGFLLISINHCIRECDVVAYELARQALVGKIHVWIDEPPASIW